MSYTLGMDPGCRALGRFAVPVGSRESGYVHGVVHRQRQAVGVPEDGDPAGSVAAAARTITGYIYHGCAS